MTRQRKVLVLIGVLLASSVGAGLAWRFRRRDPIAAAQRILQSVRSGEVNFASDLSAVAGGRHPSVDRLAALGPSVIPTLTQALGDRAYGVRLCAAWGLSRLDHPRVVMPLLRFSAAGRDTGQLLALLARRDAVVVAVAIGALRDSDAGIRRAAATHLGLAREQRAIAALAGMLGDEPGAATAAIFALGEIGGEAAADALAGAIAGVHRERIALALGKLRDRRAVDPLLEEIASRGANAHLLALLANIGDPRAVAVLQAALRDRDRRTRFIAADGLARIRIGQLPTTTAKGAAQ